MQKNPKTFQMDRAFEKNNLKIKISKEDKEERISWVKQTTVSEEVVHRIIEDFSWRKSNSLNFQILNDNLEKV